jgi:hypothetical protein
MSEIKTIALSHKEVIEAIIKQQDLHEGIWQLYIEFLIAGANVQNPETKEVAPAAIVPIKAIGLTRVDTENEIALDAAKINPKKK